VPTTTERSDTQRPNNMATEQHKKWWNDRTTGRLNEVTCNNQMTCNTMTKQHSNQMTWQLNDIRRDERHGNWTTERRNTRNCGIEPWFSREYGSIGGDTDSYQRHGCVLTVVASNYVNFRSWYTANCKFRQYQYCYWRAGGNRLIIQTKLWAYFNIKWSILVKSWMTVSVS